jgi:hypothetical protein
MLALCLPARRELGRGAARGDGEDESEALPEHMLSAIGCLSLWSRAADDVGGAVACAKLVCGSAVSFAPQPKSSPAAAFFPQEDSRAGEESLAPAAVTASSVVAGASDLWLEKEDAARSLGAVWAGFTPGHGDLLALRCMASSPAEGRDPAGGVLSPSAVAAVVRAAVAAASRARHDDLVAVFAPGTGAAVALAGSWLAHWQTGLLASAQITHTTGMPHAVASAPSVIVGAPAGCGMQQVAHADSEGACEAVTLADDAGVRESVLAGLAVLAAALQQPSDLRRFLHVDAMASAPYAQEVVYHWDRLESRPSAWCQD